MATLLREGFRWFAERLNEAAAAGGERRISGAAAIVISYLHPEGSRSADIARAMGVSRQHIHTVVRELTDAHIVTTTADPTSRRDRLIILTPDGEQRRHRALTTLADLETELAQHLGTSEFTQLRDLLTRLWSPTSSLPPRQGRE
ncbi:MarR family winged helix-turn-helix transcriptional regulator [Mangrovihabitans endophyticus]|nr:MarR family winged helix-turn-helix transcriptional regulator [Mangrovihabitans endophyticus]